MTSPTPTELKRDSARNMAKAAQDAIQRAIYGERDNTIPRLETAQRHLDRAIQLYREAAK